MKTIIAGSRDIADVKVLYDAIKVLNIPEKDITQVISGGARGADRIGEIYAAENEIELVKMPADWNKWGKSAGYRRNEDMAKIADACIALWDGVSKGTGHMIDLAKKYELKLWVYNTKLHYASGKCPECNEYHELHRKKDGCDMTYGRRGWRQLGVYDG